MNVTQTPIGNMIAWISPHETGSYIGALVGEGAAPGGSGYSAGRTPAMQICASAEEARRWIEDQAAALGLPIKWVREMPRG
jgi:hypothetical protein